MQKPHIALKQKPGRTGFNAYFAFQLDTIGVCKSDEAHTKDRLEWLLGRQVDFIATLPGLGEDSLAELRFFALPEPDAPHQGQVSVALRVRVSGAARTEALERAEMAYRGVYPNLLAVHEAYEWVPVSSDDEYRGLFDTSRLHFAGALFRRQAHIQLDRIDPLPPRRPVGFVTKAAKEPAAGDSAVNIIFPFIRNYSGLARLFDVLLLQPSETLISVLLSPAILSPGELDYLVEQTGRCERYLQLPTEPYVSDVSAFSPPLHAQASLLLEQLNSAIFTLRDDCFEMTIRVAGNEPVNTLLMEAVGTEVTGQVAAPNNLGGTTRSGLLEGGYDWVTAATAKEHRAAIADIIRMDLDPAERKADLEPSGRLRRLFDAQQANCAFRFPLPLAGTFPGLTTRLAVALPPPVTLPEEGLFIGENVYRGIRQPVRILDDDRRRHVYAVGQTGTGKSSLLLGMILQDIEAGKGVAVLDPHGELVDEILPRIPKHRIDDVRYINVENQKQIIGLNMLQFFDPLDRDRAVNHLLEMFYRLYAKIPESMGPAFELYFRNSALLEMADPAEIPMLDGILRIFVDEKYRAQRLKKCTDPLVLGFWYLAEQSRGDHSLPNFGAYVTNKLSRILYNHLVRRVVLQPESTLDFSDVLDQGRILLVDLSKGRIGDTNSAFLSMVLVSQIQRAAFARTSAQDKSQLRDFYLYIDEFQNVATDSFVAILSEARKYRLNAILTNQYIHQIPEDVRDAVGGNVGTIIAFRSGAKDAEILEQEFGPLVRRDDLLNLPNFQAYVTTLTRGEATPPFSIRTTLNDTRCDPEVVAAIQRGVARYSRPVREVEKEIARRWKA